MADLGSAEGGAVPGGGLGVCAGMPPPPPEINRAFSKAGPTNGGGGGGVRRVRPMVATSLSGPVLSFYGPWGWGVGGGGVEDCGTHTHQEN